jgi:urea transport system substrate-binding protein
MKITTKLRIAGAAAFITTGILTHTAYAQEETIKVGVLHSTTGHDGDLGDDAARRDADADRAAERGRRASGQELEPVVVDPPRTGRCLPKRRAN